MISDIGARTFPYVYLSWSIISERVGSELYLKFIDWIGSDMKHVSWEIYLIGSCIDGQLYNECNRMGLHRRDIQRIEEWFESRNIKIIMKKSIVKPI
jgi:hypothetical protein